MAGGKSLRINLMQIFLMEICVRSIGWSYGLALSAELLLEIPMSFGPDKSADRTEIVVASPGLDKGQHPCAVCDHFMYSHSNSKATYKVTSLWDVYGGPQRRDD